VIFDDTIIEKPYSKADELAPNLKMDKGNENDVSPYVPFAITFLDRHYSINGAGMISAVKRMTEAPRK